MSEEKLEALEQMILDRFESMEKTLQIILSKFEARDGGGGSGPPAIPTTTGRPQTVSNGKSSCTGKRRRRRTGLRYSDTTWLAYDEIDRTQCTMTICFTHLFYYASMLYGTRLRRICHFEAFGHILTLRESTGVI